MNFQFHIAGPVSGYWKWLCFHFYDTAWLYSLWVHRPRACKGPCKPSLTLPRGAQSPGAVAPLSPRPSVWCLFLGWPAVPVTFLEAPVRFNHAGPLSRWTGGSGQSGDKTPATNEVALLSGITGSLLWRQLTPREARPQPDSVEGQTDSPGNRPDKESSPWVHHSRIKPVAPPQAEGPWRAESVPGDPVRLKIWRAQERDCRPCSSRTRRLAGQRTAEACGEAAGRAPPCPLAPLLTCCTGPPASCGLASTAPPDWRIGPKVRTALCTLSQLALSPRQHG